MSDPTPPTAVEGAQIFDQGYRRYEGTRTGVSGSIKSLVKYSVRHVLGLGKAARFKVIPLAIVVMAYLPAAVFVGAAALIPVNTEDFLPSYADYYGFVAATIYLFAGFISPELLCTERRTGMLGVYLASPLDRPTYLLGKALAVFLLLSLVTLGPPLLMLIAFSLQNLGPDGFGEWLRVFGRILAASAVTGGLYTAVSLAVAATTDRSTTATAAILALIPGSAIITDLLVDIGDVNANARLANLLFLPRSLTYRIHEERGGWPAGINPTWTLWLACAAWILASVGWVWYRYRTLLVRR